MSIHFEYIYRDAGNYKNWGSVVFANPSNFSADRVQQIISSALGQWGFFSAAEAGLPDLHFSGRDAELDLPLHEYFGIRDTDEEPDDSAGRSIEEFLSVFCTTIRR